MYVKFECNFNFSKIICKPILFGIYIIDTDDFTVGGMRLFRYVSN